MLYHERNARKKGYSLIIGIDEAGRGPLAGPVVAAAVCLKSYRFDNRIDDSKRLTKQQRECAFLEICRKGIFGLGVLNESAIEQLNIARAADFAVDAALDKLLARLTRPRPTVKNTFLLLDGRLRATAAYHAKEIIGGDGLSLSIACASIVAKVTRDRIMDIYDRIWPQYGFGTHKGYGTRRHRDNIIRHGLSPIHRRTFCHMPG